jgi:hypothetical protein
MLAESLAAMVLLDLRVQPEHPEARDQRDHKARKDRQGLKAYRDSLEIWGLLVMRVHKVHKAHKVQQGLRVPGSAMEMPRETSSTGMGLPGRTYP